MAGYCQKKITVQTEKGSVQVSCGTCDLCRQQQLTEMVGRCLLEADAAVSVSFLTLTYAEDDRWGAKEPVPLHERGYKQAQDMLKRLRYAGHVLRYLIAMEHGRNGTERMHFHCMLFWVNNPPPLPGIEEKFQHWDFWPHGYTYHQRADVGSYGYVAKYMLKDQTAADTAKPKQSGQKREAGWKDPLRRAKGRYERLEIALEAGFDSWREYVSHVPQQRDHGIWMSRKPVFGCGHSSIPDEFSPLMPIVRQMVSSNLPFTRAYKHPNGFYHKGGEVKFVKYFMTNRPMIREAYRLYCKEWFRVHGTGDPPICNVENSEGKTERQAVLAIAYGDGQWVVEGEHAQLSIRQRLAHEAPMAKEVPRTTRAFWGQFEKAVYYSASNVMVYKRHDGRMIAVRSHDAFATKYVGAWSADIYRSVEIGKTKGYMRWPVRDLKELMQLRRGNGKATDMPLQAAVFTKRGSKRFGENPHGSWTSGKSAPPKQPSIASAS